MERAVRTQKRRKEKTIKMETGSISTLLLLFFCIPMSNVIGNEGNGYLAVSLEIYGLFYLIFAYAYTKVVTCLVMERLKKKLYRNSLKATGMVFYTSFISSIVGALLMGLLANVITEGIFRVRLAAIGLLVLTPVLVIQGVAAVFRGYFEGMGTRIPSEISRLIEVITTITGAFIIVFMAKDYGAKVGNLLNNGQFEAGFSVGGIFAGWICGSLLSCLFLGFIYIIYKKAYVRLVKKDMSRIVEPGNVLIKMIYKLVPVFILEILFIRLYRFFNLYLYSRFYIQGESEITAIRHLGSFYGQASIIMAIFIVIILALTEGNRKRIKKHLGKNEFVNGKQLIKEALQRLLSFSLPVVGSILILAKPLLKTLFGSGGQTETGILTIGAVTILFASLGIYLHRMMADLQMKKQLLIIHASAFLVQTIIMIALKGVPSIEGMNLGSLSLPLAELVFWIVLSMGELLILTKTYQIHLPWSGMLLSPVVRTAIMVVMELLIVQLLQKNLSSLLLCILAVGMGVLFHQLTRKVPLLNRE